MSRRASRPRALARRWRRYPGRGSRAPVEVGIPGVVPGSRPPARGADSLAPVAERADELRGAAKCGRQLERPPGRRVEPAPDFHGRLDGAIPAPARLVP